MTVSYNAALKSTRMQAVIAAIDADASPATLEIGQTGMSLIILTFTLNDPSFSESGGIITMLGVPKSAVAANPGTAQEARVKSGSGTIIVSGLSVNTSAADIILNNIIINSGQTVNLNSGTLTHAP